MCSSISLFNIHFPDNIWCGMSLLVLIFHLFVLWWGVFYPFLNFCWVLRAILCVFYFANFFTELFYIVEFYEFFINILDKNLLGDVQFANIFFPICSLLFCPLGHFHRVRWSHIYQIISLMDIGFHVVANSFLCNPSKSQIFHLFFFYMFNFIFYI